MFLPYCQRQSLTPAQNHRHNCSLICTNFYVLTGSLVYFIDNGQSNNLLVQSVP
jgi:hypothetical protein